MDESALGSWVCTGIHSKSRPDLVLYHTKHYHAYVIKSIKDEDRQDEDQVVRVTPHCSTPM